MQFHSTRRSFPSNSLGCVLGAADLLRIVVQPQSLEEVAVD